MGNGHGGKRAGSGRKRGSVERKAMRQKVDSRISLALDEGITPVEFFLAIMRDNRFTTESRMDAAKAAAPYIHSKLNTIEHESASIDQRQPEEGGVAFEFEDLKPANDQEKARTSLSTAS